MTSDARDDAPTPARRTFRDVVRSPGVPLLFGSTPPRLTAGPEQTQLVADKMRERIERVDVDGLILYDLQDEADRTDEPRPFPYAPTLDPAEYLADNLPWWGGPTVVYRSVGKYTPDELAAWLRAQDERILTVFVGASTSSEQVRTTLSEAFEVHARERPDLPLGAVVIPERHRTKGDEHRRMRRKQDAGCSFFVSQVVYNCELAKDLVSDYAYACQDDGVDPAPIVFTLSLCGSMRTLEFLRWLGVSVPRWVANELERDRDTLGVSEAHSLGIAAEMADFCTSLQVPFAFNVESVSTRRVEIEATVELAVAVRDVVD